MLGKRLSSDDGTSDTSNYARSYPRKRVSIACEVCRLRKTRCDAAKPACSFCADLNIKCVYKRPADSFRPESKPEELLQALKRLDRIEHALDSIAQKVGAQDFRHMYNVSSWQSPFPTSIVVPLEPSVPSPISIAAVRPTGRQHYACKMPTLLNFRHPLPENDTWSWDCSEFFFTNQMEEMLEIRKQVNTVNITPDLSDMHLWNLQQSFEEHILKWFPICDSSIIMQHIQYARSVGYHDGSASTCLALLVFANGAMAGDLSRYTPSIKIASGFTYFTRAITILERLSTAMADITVLQCRLLAGIYLHYAFRPLEAWKYFSQTSQDCILLLRSDRHHGSADQRESFNRLYWICYVMESELEACLELPSSGIRQYASNVPLPISRYEEEGMYFLLALISLRKVMVEVLDTVGYSSRMGYVSYNPAVALELKTQIDEWYNHLPATLKFSLESSNVRDQRRAYLRCAYFAVVIVATWPFIIPLTKPPFTNLDSFTPVPAQRPHGPTSHPSQDLIPTQSHNQFYHHHNSPTSSFRRTPTPISTSPYPNRSPVLNHDSPPSHKIAAQTCIDSCRSYLAFAEEILSNKSLVSHLILRQYFAFTMILILCFNGTDDQDPSSIEEKMFLQRAMSNLKAWSIVPFVKICLNKMRRVGRSKGLEAGL